MCTCVRAHVPVGFNDVGGNGRHCSDESMTPPFIKCFSDILQRNLLTFHSTWYLSPFLGQTKSIYVLMYSNVAILFLNLIPANTLIFKISPSTTGERHFCEQRWTPPTEKFECHLLKGYIFHSRYTSQASQQLYSPLAVRVVTRHRRQHGLM